MSLRRTVAALAASAALCAVAAPAASADESPSAQAPAEKSLPSALYGKGDPRYDGVWRQSLALLAQDTAGVKPAGKAVEWLAGQQCEDGAFASYRPDPTEPCAAETLADVNATAVAVQALAALGGHEARVEKAVEWLKLVQNEDGGWSFNPGGPSDANSVSLVIGALVAAGEDPAKVLSTEDESPYDSLLDFHLGCDAKADERGAFAYQPDDKGRLAANDDATAAAVLAALGEDLVVEPDGDGAAPTAPSCDKDGEPTVAEAAGGGVAYLTKVLEENGGHLKSVMPGAEEQPDYGNTADTVLALAAAGERDAARDTLTWLEKNAPKWDAFESSPAALGQLVLATHAVGGDPTDFGGTDLVELLNATGPAPASVSADADAGAEDASDGKDGGDGVSTGAVVAVAVALVVVLALSAVVVARNRKRSK
ncbi:prenyltransferase/squalene oxidase repeat-containing protein [Streptomyces megasporus]|uniref:prenyltransferase/squalene oxidase repeat-containing protein n=1 Tax=Streptomyces megasporus TaxID=44060 RepID=UPI0004E155F4|nr:prenyltransferase/squalene oxidase repeat-containing protein [Streptomyces megasporus]